MTPQDRLTVCAAVAHDIAQPMTALLWRCELVATSDDAAALRATLAEATGDLQRLMAQVRRLQDAVAGE